MKRKKKIHLPSKYTLLFTTLFCILLIFLTLTVDNASGPFKTAANYTIIPMQKGINSVGNWMTDKQKYLNNLDEVVAENERLQKQVDELTVKNSTLQQDRYELDRLREHFDLEEKYPDYDMVAARVISKDTGNWFNTFTINKGSEHGLAKDMNVIAGAGLVGRIIETGPDYARVRSIIDDSSNVSAMMLSSSDTCMVRGDLQLMNDGIIKFDQLKNNDEKVNEGDQIVTSHISSKYLEGILIGYVSEVSVDSNNLTRSGTIVPYVDFTKLHEVLVITELKKNAKTPDSEE